MSSSTRNSTAAEKHSTYISSKQLPREIDEHRKKGQNSRTLNRHLYASPDVIERLTQGATRSEDKYRAQASAGIDDFDKSFNGKS